MFGSFGEQSEREKKKQRVFVKKQTSVSKHRIYNCNRLKVYFEPAALLIAKHMNDLPFPTREVFKQKFPTLVGDPQLRKLLLIHFTNWVNQMRYIIDEEWSIGNFSDLFPPHHPFPVAVTVYLVGMVDELKDEISTRTEGQMKKANITYQEESKEMLRTTCR